MTTLFLETFTGTSNLNGHTPDTGYGAGNWDAYAPVPAAPNLANIAGGLMLATTTTNTASNGFGTYGNLGTDYSIADQILATFVFKTGSSVAPNADGHFGVVLKFRMGGRTYALTVNALVNADWKMAFSVDGAAFPSVAVYLAASTSYTGTISIANGVFVVTFAGQTMDLLDASAVYADATGLSQLRVDIGNPHGLDSLKVETVATPGSTLAVTGPSPTLTAAFGGGSALMTGPMGTLFATGHLRPTSGTPSVLPMGTLFALAGARVTLAAPSPSAFLATGTVTTTARLVASAPMGTLIASGTVTGSARADLRAPMGDLLAYGGAIQVSAAAPKGTLVATGTIGVVARLLAKAPMGILLARGTAQNHGRFLGVAPMLQSVPVGMFDGLAPMGFLVATGYAAVAVTYEGYAINLKPSSEYRQSPVNEVTHYDSGFGFDQIVRVKNQYYGVKPTGRYLIGGDLDVTAAIAWSMKTGITNFGSRSLKNVREMFVHGRLGVNSPNSVAATVSIGEAADVTYNALFERGVKAQAHRVKFGKGLSAEYYSFGLSDSTGGPADIDSMEFVVPRFIRRI